MAYLSQDSVGRNYCCYSHVASLNSPVEVNLENDIAGLSWDTAPLYPSPDSAELELDFSFSAERVEAFRGKYQGKIAGLDPASLLEVLEEFEVILERLSKPQMYAHLLFAADSEDDANKSLSQRAAEFGNLMARQLLFFDLEIMAIPDESVRLSKRRRAAGQL